MDWDQIQGNWKRFTGKIKEQWGELTEDELDAAAGERDQFEGIIQERYGKSKEEARREVDRWLAAESGTHATGGGTHGTGGGPDG